MPCEITHEDLSEYALSDCAPERATKLAAHIGSCRECAARLAALRDVDVALGALPRRSPSAAGLLEARRALSQSIDDRRPPGAHEIMSLEEVAQFLRIAEEDLEAIVDQLPSFEIAGRIRVRRARLVEWIEQRELLQMRERMRGELTRAAREDDGRGVA
jgi:hypothetical protein